MIFYSPLPHRSLPGRPTTEGSGDRIAGVANEHFFIICGAFDNPLAARALETLLHLFEDGLGGHVFRLGLKVPQQSVT